jgi:hypothetical protein
MGASNRSADPGTTRIERDPVIDAYRAGVDLSLLEKNLTLTVEERFVQLMELQRFADELAAAGRRNRSR